ncbi:amidohydrolase family protein [Roseiterribacter gracilis]|uniref:Amidohydrolase n=1 Tax=Roseiterribacter gracilis TaxID=2812848 RepID=A0A8S8X7J8_9PROT|nr:amidohydrolase [Rhodospirillales bacterium TMPK1]
MRVLLLLALLLAASPAQAETVAVTNARAFTMIGNEPVENATIVLRDGKIDSVVRNGPVPAGARVVDAGGSIVTPGLMSSGTHLGLIEIQDVAETNDHAAKAGSFGAGFDPSTALNTNSALLAQVRADGLTRAVTAPSASPVAPFSGLASVLRLEDSADILDRSKVALFATIQGGGAAGSRAVGWLELRAALDRAKAPAKDGVADENGNALRAVLAGKIPLVINVNRESDIRQAIQLGGDYKIRIVIGGGNEAWRVARELAARKIPVVVNPFANIAATFETLGARPDNASLLQRAGVTLVFNIALGRGTQDAAVAVREAAGLAVAHGMPWIDALKGLTVNAAQIWGITDHYGTLAPGRDADLVVWDGDPLEPSSAPKHVFVRGKEASRVTRQSLLRDRYAPDAAKKTEWPSAYR